MFDLIPKMLLFPVKKKDSKWYIILHNFINCPVFIDIKQTLHYAKCSTRVNIIIETFIFCALLPYVCLPYLRWIKLCSGCFRQVFFYLEDKKSGLWSR